MKMRTCLNQCGNTMCKCREQGFSLMELLAVIAIIAIVMGLLIPNLNRSTASFHLNAAGRAMLDQLNLARQMARSKNANVEVRLYQLPDYGQSTNASPTVYRGFQIFTIDQNGRAIAFNKPEYFQSPVYISFNTTESAFFTERTTAGSAHQERAPVTSGSNQDPKLPSFAWNYKYTALQFTPSGATDLKAGQNFFTLLLQNGKSLAQGTNYFTIQIDPITGSPRSFRP